MKQLDSKWYAPENGPRAMQPPTLDSPVREFPKVAILLCTYHGQKYLVDQLESFAAQTHPNWKVWASDDGSEDATHAILDVYQKKWCAGRLSIQHGPAKGFVANFLSLSCNAGIEADYYAYSDQDDIWEADKLQRALAWLETVPRNIPALYCSRTRLVDANNNDIGLSPLIVKPLSFANALMQNVVSGNTMVFNNAVKALLREAGNDVGVITHDWWVYMVATGCGGEVFFDPIPSLRYRQHGNNIIGINSSWRARLQRFRMTLRGRLSEWNDRNIQALQRIKSRLTPDNRRVLEQFALAREQPLIPRMTALKRSGVYRQTLLGNLGLMAAALLGKI